MDRLDRLAELSVVVGANVRPGQVVQVRAAIEQSEIVHAIADAAYRHGARYVEAQFTTPLLQRSMVVYGPAEAYVPDWADAPIYGVDEVGGARIMVMGPLVPGVLDDLDPVLVDRAQPPRSRAWRDVEYRVNNTIVPGPHRGWAQARYPDLDPVQALLRLWDDIATALRLDDPDPIARWRERFAKLAGRAEELTAANFDAVRFQGPGTDLEVGLLPGARWESPTNVNEHGVLHAWNLPSEEVYTSPDPLRVNGHVQLSRPAVVGGALVHDVRLAFQDGEVVQVTGGPGVDRLRAFIARDAGTRRVGEIALVDSDSAVAQVDRPFGLVLLDENVAAHLAVGFGFPELVSEQMRGRVNGSGDHLDLTIGSSELTVTARDRASGEERDLIREDRWVASASAPADKAAVCTKAEQP